MVFSPVLVTGNQRVNGKGWLHRDVQPEPYPALSVLSAAAALQLTKANAACSQACRLKPTQNVSRIQAWPEMQCWWSGHGESCKRQIVTPTVSLPYLCHRCRLQCWPMHHHWGMTHSPRTQRWLGQFRHNHCCTLPCIDCQQVWMHSCWGKHRWSQLLPVSQYILQSIARNSMQQHQPQQYEQQQQQQQSADRNIADPSASLC